MKKMAAPMILGAALATGSAAPAQAQGIFDPIDPISSLNPLSPNSPAHPANPNFDDGFVEAPAHVPEKKLTDEEIQHRQAVGKTLLGVVGGTLAGAFMLYLWDKWRNG